MHRTARVHFGFTSCYLPGIESVSHAKLTIVKSVAATVFEHSLNLIRTYFILMDIFIILKVNVKSIGNGGRV